MTQCRKITARDWSAARRERILQRIYLPLLMELASRVWGLGRGEAGGGGGGEGGVPKVSTPLLPDLHLVCRLALPFRAFFAPLFTSMSPVQVLITL